MTSLSGLIPSRIVHATTWDFEGGYQAYSVTASAPASAAWPTADLGIAVPYRLPEPTWCRRLFVVNGTAVAGNVCVAIYDRNWNRLVTSTATAQAGTSDIQYFDVTDTLLPAGLLHIAVSMSDATTARIIRSAPTVLGLRRNGVVQQASVGTLPDPFVPATVANAFLPLAGFTSRATP